MKMSKPGLCCDSCFSCIAKRSTDAAKLWLDLCEVQSRTSECFGLIPEDFPTLRLLEILGFIISTESSHMIKVKVLGKTEDSLGIYFCGGDCDV